MDREPSVVVELVEPSLVLLVGAAGSGKTTFAGRHFPPDTVISSDALREEIAGDADDQSRNAAVFRVLHDRVAARLAAGRLVVVDATNVQHHARRALVRIAARAGVPVTAVVWDLALEVVLQRNATRPGRTVPDDVVARQHATLARALVRGVLATEGFDRVVALGHELAEETPGTDPPTARAGTVSQRR